MNQKQYEAELDKAEDTFKEVIGACYVFLRNNSNVSEESIIGRLQYGVAKVIEEIKDMEVKN